MAKILDIPFIDNRYKKPNIKLLDYFPKINKPMILIGDKVTTDWMFANKINAKFIKVKRYKAKKERMITNIFYLWDDLCYLILKIFFKI